MSLVEVVVYGRKDCHLCHDMINAVDQARHQLAFDFLVVDIDTDKDLVARYGERIPVLVGGEEEICHYHFDLAALGEYLSRIG